MMYFDHLHVCMPGYHNFTCGIHTNNIYKGLLHIYARHHPELEQHIAGLAILRVRLPSDMQTSLNSIAAAFNMNAAASDVSRFKNLLARSGNARAVLYKAQMLVLQFIQRVINSSTTPPARTTNTSGQPQLRYSLTSNTELIVGPSYNIEDPNPSFKDPRNIVSANHKIIVKCITFDKKQQSSTK
uniref:Reverse transcriptase domain-containing protein n=1 Tax=Panagrellus redivivus TaxID=6233 RepID=A0A7E4V606_PANRE